MIDNMIDLFPNGNCCMSGGATGSDVQWGMCAGNTGHSVIHWSFAGHKSYAPDIELVILGDDQLKSAATFVTTAATRLKKRPPSNQYVANLIRRNYFQVAWSDSLYAVTTFKDAVPQGGTAWAISMFMDLHPANNQCYVFDQLTGIWMQRSGEHWDALTDQPISPSGVWAGIGTRELSHAGKMAIRSVMGYTK
jgi:hypothetical protein